MKQLSTRILIVAATVVALGAVAGEASARTWRQTQFDQCMAGKSQTAWNRYDCCVEVGGAWAEIYDEYGNAIDGWCTDGQGNSIEQTDESDQTWTKNTESTSRTGTAEQPEQETWSGNNTESTSTTGTAEQESSSSTSESTYSYDGSSRWGSSTYEEETSSYEEFEESAPRKRGYYD